MVIGNGLLAQTFLQYIDSKNITIVASGVSNSSEVDSLKFLRELALIKGTISSKSDTQIIYFSTVSIHDPHSRESHYVKHKLAIENLISTTAPNYIIFRLPILVGNTNNPNTLINHLFNKIIQREQIEVHSNACRYLLGTEALNQTISWIINEGMTNREIIDVCFNNRITLPNLLSLLEDITQIQINKKILDIGTCYTVNNSGFLKKIEALKYKIPNDYNKKILTDLYRNKFNI